MQYYSRLAAYKIITLPAIRNMFLIFFHLLIFASLITNLPMKRKILIAEDERIIALDISNQLKTLNYEITSIVSTGEDAITECRLNRPDIVLMDIGLKGALTGTQAASTIFNEMQIPIVHLTGSKKKLHETGLTYPLIFLTKPFERKLLQETLEKIFKS
jgi:CheY-like chemotaxis protein